LNLFELAQTTDLALMWHGTSALELGVLGIPTILSAYYGEINCPVGHAVPKSRKDYERLILGYSKSALSIEIRRRSAALIDYLRHKDISTPYRYTNRGFTNRYIQLRWFADDLKAYESCGDDNVTALADRIAGVQGKSGAPLHGTTQVGSAQSQPWRPWPWDSALRFLARSRIVTAAERWLAAMPEAPVAASNQPADCSPKTAY
jgi:hypothetical protein